MKIRNKKDNSSLTVNTSALPDIIFMLLFFFMVTTVLRTHTVQTSFELPKSESRTKLLNRKDVIHLYVGKGLIDDAPNIQINDMIIGLHRLESALIKIKGTSEFSQINVSLKADKDIQMKIVNEVKLILRKQNLRKLQYVSDPTA